MKKLYSLPLLIFILISMTRPSIATQDTIVLHMDRLSSPELVKEFYESRGYEPAWTKQGKYSLKAYSFLHLLNNAQYYGLNSDNYHLKELLALKDAKPSSKNTGRMESLLTDSFFTFALHLKKGQLSNETSKIREKKTEDTQQDIAFLENALRSASLKSELESLEPAHPNYQKLKAKLQNKLDDHFKNALWTGKNSDDLKTEIQKLALNMERWRWEEGSFAEKHILVNLPSFMLEVWENGEVTMASKVIVGSSRQKTPMSDSQIESFIIHPTYIPEKILAEELLPIILKDPTYLSRNNYEILDNGKLIEASSISWDGYDEETFPYALRQPDPDHKSLGIIKFELDSTNLIHDSESKLHFVRNLRALSGGCVIIEKAEDLAQYLAMDEEGISSSQLKEMFKQKAYAKVEINEPMHVYIRYFTADGTKIYQDVYGMDKALLVYFDDMVQWDRSNYNLQRTR